MGEDMKETIKKRWVKALRSGAYDQAGGTLYDGEGFCCLGVLYDIEYDGDWQHVGEDVIEGDGETIFSGEWMIDRNASHLSDKFREKCFISDSAETSLINLNDEGSSFPEIADWIDENL